MISRHYISQPKSCSISKLILKIQFLYKSLLCFCRDYKDQGRQVTLSIWMEIFRIFQLLVFIESCLPWNFLFDLNGVLNSNRIQVGDRGGNVIRLFPLLIRGYFISEGYHSFFIPFHSKLMCFVLIRLWISINFGSDSVHNFGRNHIKQKLQENEGSSDQSYL